jgi:hypothetical protein
MNTAQAIFTLAAVLGITIGLIAATGIILTRMITSGGDEG